MVYQSEDVKGDAKMTAEKGKVCDNLNCPACFPVRQKERVWRGKTFGGHMKAEKDVKLIEQVKSSLEDVKAGRIRQVAPERVVWTTDKRPYFETMKCPSCGNPEVIVIENDWTIAKVGHGGLAMCSKCGDKFQYRIVFPFEWVCADKVRKLQDKLRDRIIKDITLNSKQLTKIGLAVVRTFEEVKQ